MQDFASWTQGPGFGPKSEADPYGLGDYANGSVIGNSGLYKYGDESQGSFLQRLYGAASDPSFGTEGRSFAQMQNAGFFNELAPVNVGGQSYNRTGENLQHSYDQGGDYATTINKMGGANQSVWNDQYGWLTPPRTVSALGPVSAKANANWTDWLPTIFGVAATAGVGALGAAGAAAGAAGEGAAAGGAFEGAAAGASGGYGGLSEAAIGQLARQGVSAAGSEMSGGNSTNSLIGMAGTAYGGWDSGGMDTSWGVNARDGSNMDWTDAADNLYDPSMLDGGGGYDLSAFDGATAGADGGIDWGSMLSSGGGSLLKLLGGSGGSNAGLMKLLGGAGSAALGYAGGNAQINAYKQMQDRFLGLGAPSRARLEASYAPGFDMAASDPAYKGAMDQSAKSVLARLSASGGNPWDSPGSLMEANKYVTQSTALPQLNAYRSANASSGGLGVNTAGTAAGGAAGSAGGPYDAIGAGLYNVTKPQGTTLEDLARQYKLSSGWNN